MRNLVLAGLVILLAACAPNEPPRNVEMLQGNGELEVASEEVNYHGNARGLLARPTAGGPYPGVILIHEWWGLNDNIKDMARELASEGYVVLAADLYHGEVATTRERAQQLTGGIDQDDSTENLRAAAAYLRETHHVPRLASLGWCFGGAQSLQLALSGERMDATAIYYGRLVTDPSKLQAITWPVLGVFGAEDQGIPVSSVNEFDAALDALGVENEIHIYPGVGHAFANPSGANYAPEETEDAWQKTVTFLNRHLKG